MTTTSLPDDWFRPGLPPEWYDRSKQQRCNLCGRFAYWSIARRRWALACTYYDAETGGYEHE